MFAAGAIAFICLALLGAWFFLDFEMAEGFLILIVLGTALLAGYWACIGDGASYTAKGVGLFASMIIAVGLLRLAVEKLNNAVRRKPRQ